MVLLDTYRLTDPNRKTLARLHGWEWAVESEYSDEKGNRDEDRSESLGILNHQSAVNYRSTNRRSGYRVSKQTPQACHPAPWMETADEIVLSAFEEQTEVVVEDSCLSEPVGLS